MKGWPLHQFFVWITSLFLVGCGLRRQDYLVFVNGLNEPRGMWMQPDGTLCVAEAGRLNPGQEDDIQGTMTSRANGGSLICVDRSGEWQQLAKNLPYVLYTPSGTSVGPTDVVEMDGALYLLTGEGEGTFSRAVLEIDQAGMDPTIVADFFHYTTETTEPDFFDEIKIFSNPFALIPDESKGRFLVTDGATGHVLSAGLDGQIDLFSEVEGYEVLTGIAWGPDDLPYVASFSSIPHSDGAGQILRLYEDGSIEVVVDRVTTPIDLAFDENGRLYVLEFVSGSELGEDPYRDKAGQLLRFDPTVTGWHNEQVLVTGLPFPIGLLIAPDQNIYISIHGAYSSPGSGAVLKFDDLVGRERINRPVRITE